MDHRLQRFLIPATLVLMFALFTVWLSINFEQSNSFWSDLKNLEKSGILTFFIAVGVTNFGLGYICHLIFTGYLFWNMKERFYNKDQLIDAFNLKPHSKAKIERSSYNTILAEFHFRFHARASTGIKEFCSRRNSAWYIAKTSGIAGVIGFISGVLFIYKNYSFKSLNCLGFGLITILVVMFLVLSFVVGTIWNKEFWEVSLKWIQEDVMKNKITYEWLKIHGLDKVLTLK